MTLHQKLDATPWTDNTIFEALHWVSCSNLTPVHQKFWRRPACVKTPFGTRMSVDLLLCLDLPCTIHVAHAHWSVLLLRSPRTTKPQQHCWNCWNTCSLWVAGGWGVSQRWCVVIFFTSASKFHIEANGGIFDVIPQNDLASPIVWKALLGGSRVSV